MTVTDLCYMLASTTSPAPPSNITQAYSALVANTADWMLNGHSQPPSPFLTPSIESRKPNTCHPSFHAGQVARVHEE